MTPELAVQEVFPDSKPGLARIWLTVPEVTVSESGAAWVLSVDEPEPGAAIEVGSNAAAAPEGSPEALSEMAELKPPETAVETVVFTEPPCTAETEPGEAEIVKSGLVLGLKMMFSTGWSSIPFGATPVWPCRKSNMPTPVIWTGMLAVWKLPVGVNLASSWLWALVIRDRN